MSAHFQRLRDQWGAIPRVHRLLLVGAMALGAAVVIAYAIATRHNDLAGDQKEYDLQGRFFTEGKFWWSTVVLYSPHPTAWKAPIYPVWVGLWYELLGAGASKIAIVQGLLLAPLTVFLTWLTARRWFGLQVAALSAFVIAVFPLSWEYIGLLYSEALATPLIILVLYLALRREPPSRLRAAGIGALIGVCLLVRPTSFFLFAGVFAAWVVATGWKRAILLTVVSGVCAVLVVVPWTIRNAVVLDGFVPISIQDAAAYGTFNDEAANDPDRPWLWRPTPLLQELRENPPSSEVEFRSDLQDRAYEYISDHPSSVLKAFFWNGLSRLWDLRRPSQALFETPFEGRSRALGIVGLAMYYVLLPLALIGIWRSRARIELLAPLLAVALAMSVVYTIDSGTRYRAPVEPIIVILACSGLTLLPRFRTVQDGSFQRSRDHPAA